ncbi:MAG: hypothetical protein ACKVQJ_00555 [Pyrinomonadaceae bacterium]
MDKGNGRSTYVGECIYCGSTENLTDEHAIPLALQGNRLLREASCLRCNKVTTRFERSILRNSMLATRTVLGMPTRKKKNRPETLPMIFVRDNIRTEEQVPVDDAIPSLILPELGPPEVYPEIGHAYGLRAGVFEVKNHLPVDRVTDEHIRMLLKKYKADAVETPFEINHQAFLRLLAKIAMTEAIGFFGLRNFEKIYVRNAVLGKDRTQWWVGSDGFYDIHFQGGFDDSAHVIAAVRPRGQREVWIRIKLWNKSITPEYIVVVGNLLGNYARFLDAHKLIT